MKRIIFLLLGACLCACGRYGCGVPAGYEPLLDAALAEYEKDHDRGRPWREVLADLRERKAS